MTEAVHIPREPVLIIEDRKEIREHLHKLCEQMGVASALAENGEVALNLVKSNSFSVYLVDLLMPIMDGRAFITHLKQIHPDSVILIETAIDDPGMIIDIMKLGVFDYVIKPIDIEQFQITLRKALEFKYLKDMEKYQKINADRKLRGQLEWLVYKEKRRKEGHESQEKNVIYNLKTNLSQGGGIGTMISIIDVIKSTARKEEGGNIVVSGELADLLFENNEISRLILGGLDQIIEIIDRDFPLEKVSSARLVGSIPKMLERTAPHLPKKNLHLSFPDQPPECQVEVNFKMFTLALEELIINALKYSVPDSKIDIFAHISKGYFGISVKNAVKGNPPGGIPPEYEKLVLEPFFRLSPMVDDFSSIEVFSLGLGLTVVDHIIKKHNGLFFIQDVKDFTGPSVTNCVLAEVLIPVILEDA